MEVLLCERVNDLCHSIFHHLNCLITTVSELRELAKVTGSKISTIGRLRDCVDAHLGQIVCDKDGVVDWWIVLQKIPLTRFQENWPLRYESLPELPKNNNIVTLTLTLWPIDSGVLTSLLLPHLLPSFTDSLPSLNLFCHSKTDAHFMQDGQKAVWSIPYVSVAFSPSLKQFYCISFFLVSSLHFFNSPAELWQSGFSRVYCNSCCSCLFYPEIINVGQPSHKIYSNNILNFQEYTTILNACTKKSGNLLKAPWLFDIYDLVWLGLMSYQRL